MKCLFSSDGKTQEKKLFESRVIGCRINSLFSLAGHVERVVKKRNNYRFLWGNVQKDGLKDLSLCVRIGKAWTIKWWEGISQTGSVWLKYAHLADLCEHGNENPYSKCSIPNFEAAGNLKAI